MGVPAKRRRHGLASHRAHRPDHDTRALSVAIPVSAYIWRYILEISTKASRPRLDLMNLDRFQIEPRL